MSGESFGNNKAGRDVAKPRTAALIVAGGRGFRLGGEVPKQYLNLGGLSILRRTIEQFLDADCVDMVQVVIHPDDQSLYASATQDISDGRLNPPVTGGATRAKTTINGLESLEKFEPNFVLIHDAARPFVTHGLIERVITALEGADGVFAGVPLVDALWQVEGDLAHEPVPRDGIWRAQTPQGFSFKAILAAHRAHSADLADDVAVARAAGLRVRAVMGSEDNFKITLVSDLERAERLIMLKNYNLKSDS